MASIVWLSYTADILDKQNWRQEQTLWSVNILQVAGPSCAMLEFVQVDMSYHFMVYDFTEYCVA